MICFHKYRPVIVVDSSQPFEYGTSIAKKKCIKCGKVKQANANYSIFNGYSRRRN